MNTRGRVGWVAALGAAILIWVSAGNSAADLVRHYPRYFHDPPRFGSPPSSSDRLGGQQGLVTFFIENREELGLSEDQVVKLKAARNTYRKASARIRADIMEAEEGLSDLMRLDEMSMEAIETASKRIEALEHDLRVAFAQAIFEGKQTLTERQLKKAKELRDRLTHLERS